MGPGHAHGHGHSHAVAHGPADRRWLALALAVITAFMLGEVIVGFAIDSLVLLSDAAHLTTDAAALLLAILASKIAERPARGAYTYGYARVDALSGQANGITLLVLAGIVTVEAVRRLADPPAPAGGTIVIVALVGVVMNAAASALAMRADRASLNIRGAVAHLVNDLWAFLAAAVAGTVILVSGWTRADPLASLVVAALMAWTGTSLVRDAGRVFLQRAPMGVDVPALGGVLAAVDGVGELHDLHVWDMGSGEAAMSAHVLVRPPFDCHAVGDELRAVLRADYGIRHSTLQVDHLSPGGPTEHCDDAHGVAHSVYLAHEGEFGVEQ